MTANLAVGDSKESYLQQTDVDEIIVIFGRYLREKWNHDHRESLYLKEKWSHSVPDKLEIEELVFILSVAQQQANDCALHMLHNIDVITTSVNLAMSSSSYFQEFIEVLNKQFSKYPLPAQMRNRLYDKLNGYRTKSHLKPDKTADTKGSATSRSASGGGGGGGGGKLPTVSSGAARKSDTKKKITKTSRPQKASKAVKPRDGKRKAVGAGTKQQRPEKPKRTKVHKESGCESCKTHGKPTKLIARNLQWWCDSCLGQPGFKRVFRCCLKKSCQNTQEFSAAEYLHSSWRCDDCKDKRNRDLRVNYSRNNDCPSSDTDKGRDDSPQAQEGRANRRKRRRADREKATTCRCGEKITLENKADSGSRSLCRVCEIMNRFEESNASATKVASLCRTYLKTQSCEAGTSCGQRHLANAEQQSVLKTNLGTLCRMTWSHRKDVLESVDNFFVELEEPELMQVSSNTQQGKENDEFRLFCSCFRKPATSEKQNYVQTFIDGYEQQNRRAPLVGSQLKIKKTLGCDFNLVIKKQLSGIWRVAKVAGIHDARCYDVNLRVNEELKQWATKLLQNDLALDQVLHLWKQHNMGKSEYSKQLHSIFETEDGDKDEDEPVIQPPPEPPTGKEDTPAWTLKRKFLANIQFKIKRRQWLSPDALNATYRICELGTDLGSGVRGTLESQKNKAIIYWRKQQCCPSCPNHMAHEGSDASAASSKDQGLRYCANDNCIPLIIILQDQSFRTLVDKEKHYLKAGFIDSTFNVSKASVKLTGAGAMARNGTYAPLMYMISTRIDEASIDLMLEHLKIMCPEFEPTVFLTDKDLALGNALRNNYHQAQHRLCFVHVNDAWRKWLADPKHGVPKVFQEIIRQDLRALSFAKTSGDLESGWRNLQSYLQEHNMGNVIIIFLIFVLLLSCLII